MFTLDHIVPWGRSFDEYQHMFVLTETDLRSRILGCADGPASFNAEATARGCRVISFDPLYRFDADAIRTRIDATYDVVMEQTRRNIDEFVWTAIPDVEELGRLRMQAMRTFLDDYEAGRREGHGTTHGSVSPGVDSRTVQGRERGAHLSAAGPWRQPVASRRAD